MKVRYFSLVYNDETYNYASLIVIILALQPVQSHSKPFIFTYSKTPPANSEDSLADFKKKLIELKHFYANFNDINDLWNQFNKELDRLETADFAENKRPGNESILTTFNQTADKIYNIDKIEKADFS